MVHQSLGLKSPIMWLALTLISFLGFFVSMFALVRRGFTTEGSFRRAGFVFAATAAFSALVWAFSLSRVPPPYPIEITKRYETPKRP